MDRKELRRIEQNWRREFKKQKEQSMNPLKQHLKNILPAYMVPGNVGDFTEVTWPFWHTVEFDFGTNPVFGPNTRQTKSFQVTQEAGFLVTGISRKTYAYSTASELAPLQIEIRDRQSSRQLNDRPIPLQMIGKKSRQTVLPTAYLLMPNAAVDIIMSSWLTADAAASVGSGKVEISIHGYRMRIEDAEKVLSTVYGRK